MNAIPFLVVSTVAVGLAQQVPQAEPREAIERYAIYVGDSMFGDWNYLLEPMDPAAMHAAYGHEYAWFRQGANRYVVTDPAVLEQLRKAVEPQNEINRMKDELNAENSRLHMRQMMTATLTPVLELMQQRQTGVADVNFRQKVQEAAQARTDEEHQKIDELQRKIDAEQKRVSSDYNARISEILDSAVRQRLAQRLP